MNPLMPAGMILDDEELAPAAPVIVLSRRSSSLSDPSSELIRRQNTFDTIPEESILTRDIADLRTQLSAVLDRQHEVASDLRLLADRQIATETTAASVVQELQLVLNQLRQNSTIQEGVINQQAALQQQDILHCGQVSAEQLSSLREDTQHAIRHTQQVVHETFSQLSEQADRNAGTRMGRDDRNLRNDRIRNSEPASSSADIPRMQTMPNVHSCPPQTVPPSFHTGVHMMPGGPMPMPNSSVPPPYTAAPIIQVAISDPPKFREERYELFRKELLWWRDVNTGISDQQLCATLAIRTEGLMKSYLIKFMEVTRTNLIGRTLEKLIQYLDENLAKSTQESTITKIGLWSSLAKKSDETFKSFWLRWDKIHDALIRANMVFSPEVDYFRALSALGLRQPQLSILLGTLESRNLPNSTAELKRASIKLFETSFQSINDDVLKTERIPISDDEGGTEDSESVVESFVGNDGETYVLRKATPKKKSNKTGHLQSSWNNARHSYNVDNRGEAGAKKPFETYAATPGSKNACIRCGSESHMWRRCHLPFQRQLAFPSRPTPPSNTNVVAVATETVPGVSSSPSAVPALKPEGGKEEQHSVRMTEEEWVEKWNSGLFDSEEIRMVSSIPETVCVLAESNVGRAVIDSGATNTVVGQLWIQTFFHHCTLPKISPSSKKFRFGDSRSFDSMGSIDIPLVLEGYTSNSTPTTLSCTIQADVIKASIPLLISRNTLKRMGSQINFLTNVLTMSEKFSMNLILATNGHLILPLKSRPSDDTDRSNTIFAQTSVDSKNREDRLLIKRVHLQLSHLNKTGLTRLFKSSSKIVSEEDIEAVLKDCPCIDQHQHSERPIAKEYIPSFCGHTLFVDVFFPIEEGNRGKQQNPFLLITCGLSRFCVCRALKRLLPQHVIGGIVDWWFFYYGRCRVIVSDKGPGFVGPQWGVFCQTYGLVHVGVATLASHSNGMVERQIGLIKEGIRSCREMTQMWTAEKIIQHVVLARNIVPLLSTGISPLAAMSGRNDLLAALDDTPAKLPPNLTIDSEDMQIAPGYAQLLQIVELRNQLAMFEANRVVSTCSGRRLRTGSKEVFSVGDVVEVFFPTTKMWQSSFRVMGLLSSQLILERGRTLFKHPRCWVRKKQRPSTITLDPEDVVILPKKNTDAAEEAPSSSSDRQGEPILNSMIWEERLSDRHGVLLAVGAISDLFMEPQYAYSLHRMFGGEYPWMVDQWVMDVEENALSGNDIASPNLVVPKDSCEILVGGGIQESRRRRTRGRINVDAGSFAYHSESFSSTRKVPPGHL